MVGLHGTDPATIYLSARARVPSMTLDDMDRALYRDRTLVKHMAMRRTLWVFPRHNLATAQAGASQRVADRERRRLATAVEKDGVHPDGGRWLERAEREVLDALSGGREATTSEVRDELPILQFRAGPAGPAGPASVAPRVFTVLSAAGELVRSGNQGKWYTSRPRWSTMASWLGEPIPALSEEEGVAGLVEAWLRAFGPGTETDIKWWLGGTLGSVRKALEVIGAQPVDLGDEVGWLMADDLEPVGEAASWCALLPGLDPTIMGWKVRGWYLGDHGPLLFDSNGNAGPTVWVDGRVVGGWRQDEGGAVEIQILEDVGAEARATLDEKADHLEKWLDGRRVTPRFPSPLWQGEA